MFCLHVVAYVYLVLWSSEESIGSPELQFWVVVSYYVGARTQTWATNTVLSQGLFSNLSGQGDLQEPQ